MLGQANIGLKVLYIYHTLYYVHIRLHVIYISGSMFCIYIRPYSMYISYFLRGIYNTACFVNTRLYVCTYISEYKIFIRHTEWFVHIRLDVMYVIQILYA